METAADGWYLDLQLYKSTLHYSCCLSVQFSSRWYLCAWRSPYIMYSTWSLRGFQNIAFIWPSQSLQCPTTYSNWEKSIYLSVMMLMRIENLFKVQVNWTVPKVGGWEGGGNQSTPPPAHHHQQAGWRSVLDSRGDHGLNISLSLYRFLVWCWPRFLIVLLCSQLLLQLW